MRSKHLRRVISLVLAFAMFIIFPMAFTLEAQAASTKTFYFRTSFKQVAKYSTGDKDSYTTKSTYGKNGLIKTRTYSDGSKSVYTHDKYGYVKTEKSYDPNGKLDTTYSYVYKYGKNGLPKTEKQYMKIGSGKKELLGTSTYTYYANKRYKKIIYKTEDGKATSLYRKDGTQKSYTFKGKNGYSTKATYDSHGSTKTWIYTGDGYTSKENHTTLKYDKKGNIIKDVYTMKTIYGGDTYKSKCTETTKYTYDKHNNITKSVTKIKNTDSSGNTTVTTYTNTYKWKAIKVAKKYWHLFDY